MKKFTLNALLTLAFLFFADIALMAQVLPNNWTGDTDIETYQETTIVYSGSSSCKVVVNSGTQANCDLTNNVAISVTAGDTYTFSFWANTSNGVRITGALDWAGASATYSNIYVGPATGGWSQFTFSDIVPAGATAVNLRMRFYDVSGFVAPETQYVDDVTFESPTGTPKTVTNGGFESWPSASSISSAYAVSTTAIDVRYGVSMASVSASSYTLTGSSTITFSSATIDAADNHLVHLSGASTSMASDNILDKITDAANVTNFDFYAGIMPIYYTNPTNPSGIIDNTHLATYQGIISANDAYNNTWVSDAAGARNGVMIFDANFDGLVAVGDEVLFTATRAVYLNQTELVTPMLLSTISTGNAPYGPTIIDGSEISETIPANTDPGEKWEGQLITIENFTVESYTDFEYTCSWSNGSSTFYFHVGDNVDFQLIGISMAVGNAYASITGVGDWYNSGPYYRINPRSQDDIGGPPAPYITVVGPNGGEILEKGLPYVIEWDYGYWENDVKIELLQEGYDPQLIATNISVTLGAFTWTVWESIEANTNYKIKVSSLDPSEPSDESNGYFSIIDQYEVPDIVITEIMYNPPESGNDSLEFVELYNNGINAVNLEGFYFSKGIEFTFPAVEILPDTFLLVAINSSAMLSTFGVESLEWASGALNNGGEELELNDPYGNVIDFVPYGDAMPWDTLADGFGPSLTLCNPNANNALAESWTASDYLAAINAAGDSIWATPGFGCQLSLFAGFEGTPTLIPIGGNVVFTDLTAGDPTTWLWTFEGGEPETFEGQVPPPIVYNEEGMWDVTLYVSDGVNSDELTYVDYIEVLSLDAPTSLEAVVGGNDDVQLSWNQPGVSTSELIYDNDVTTGAYSYNGYTMSTHMSPEGNCKVLALKYYTTTDVGDNTFNANVYGWDETQPGTELIYTEVVTAEEEMWVVVDVSAQDISFTGDFVVGFGSFNETTFVGYDENLNNGRSWDFDNDQLWEQWSEAYLIRAIVEYPNGRVAEIGNTSSQISSRAPSARNAVHSNNYSGVEIVAPVNNQNRQVSGLLGYNVYRDNAQINGELVLVTEYIDAEPPIGSHDYYVTAVYDAGESGPSNVVSVVVTNINEATNGSIVVYPNPSNGNFTIRLAENASVEFTLFDVTGKEVFRSSLNETSSFSMPNLQKGIYFISLLDEPSKATTFKKLIVR